MVIAVAQLLPATRHATAAEQQRLTCSRPTSNATPLPWLTFVLRPQASADHFMLVAVPRGDNTDKPSYKRAGDISVGETMLTMTRRSGEQPLVQAVVVATRVVRNTGLFAPLTTGGTVIVDGVVASVHR